MSAIPKYNKFYTNSSREASHLHFARIKRNKVYRNTYVKKVVYITYNQNRLEAFLYIFKEKISNELYGDDFNE